MTIAIPDGRGGAVDPAGKPIKMFGGPAVPMNAAARKADKARREGRPVPVPPMFRGAR